MRKVDELKNTLEERFLEVKFEIKKYEERGYVLGNAIWAEYKEAKMRIFDDYTVSILDVEDFTKKGIEIASNFIKAVNEHQKNPITPNHEDYEKKYETYSYDFFIFYLKMREYEKMRNKRNQEC